MGSARLGFLVLQWLGRVAGSTRPERLRSLPGDGVVRRPQVRTDHARTLPAPPETVWPWLTQMGWHRAGWYTPRWVDRALFPDNRPSADHLDPRWVRELRAGDRIPDGPPGTAEFVVEQADPPQVLLLHSTTHLPDVVARPSRLPRGLDLVLPPDAGRDRGRPGCTCGFAAGRSPRG